jgi:hypothetical protein
MIPCKPVVHLDLSCSTQQRMPNMQVSFGRLAKAVLRRGTAAVLLGLALLGAATPAREFDFGDIALANR